MLCPVVTLLVSAQCFYVPYSEVLYVALLQATPLWSALGHGGGEMVRGRIPTALAGLPTAPTPGCTGVSTTCAYLEHSACTAPICRQIVRCTSCALIAIMGACGPLIIPVDATASPMLTWSIAPSKLTWSITFLNLRLQCSFVISTALDAFITLPLP